MNLVAQGEPFDARLRCFQTAARTKLIQYRGNFAAKKKTHRYTELFSTKVEMRLPPCIALGSLYSRSSLRFSSLCPFTQEDSDDNL